MFSCLIDVDIPRLTSYGIYFSSYCFRYTYSLQSSSTHSLISSSFDATALTAYIMNSQYVPFEISELTKSSKELIIPNDCFNANDIISFKIANKENSKSIVIGNGCFGKVRVFELNGLDELESVVIGKESFTYAKTYDDIWNSKRTDGSCRIVNCPKLKSIQFCGYSFSDYHSFELNSLSSLQSIEICGYCFYYAPSFSLTGLIDGLV